MNLRRFVKYRGVYINFIADMPWLGRIQVGFKSSCCRSICFHRHITLYTTDWEKIDSLFCLEGGKRIFESNWTERTLKMKAGKSTPHSNSSMWIFYCKINCFVVIKWILTFLTSVLRCVLLKSPVKFLSPVKQKEWKIYTESLSKLYLNNTVIITEEAMDVSKTHRI